MTMANDTLRDAAPELLAMCKELVNCADFLNRKYGYKLNHSMGAKTQRFIEDCRNTISKVSHE